MRNTKIAKSITIMLCIICVLIVVNACTRNRLVDDVIQTIKQYGESSNSTLTYDWIVYNNLDDNNVKIAITFQCDDGINEIETPNGEKIQGNGKDKVAIDYEITPNVEKRFKIKLMNNQNIEESFVATADDIQEKITEKVINEIKFGDLVIYDNKFFRVRELENKDNIELLSEYGMGAISFKGKKGWDSYISTLNSACAKLFDDQRILNVRSAKREDYATASSVWLANTAVIYERVDTYSLPRWIAYANDWNGRGFEYLASASPGPQMWDNGPYTHDICPVITVAKTSINAIGNNQWYIK